MSFRSRLTGFSGDRSSGSDESEGQAPTGAWDGGSQGSLDYPGHDFDQRVVGTRQSDSSYARIFRDVRLF